MVRSQKNSHMHFFAVTKSDNIANSLNLHFAIRHSSILLNNCAGMAIHTRLVTYIYLVTYYVRLNLVMLVFVRPNSSYVRPKLKVIGQMSCQVKYLFAALWYSSLLHWHPTIIYCPIYTMKSKSLFPLKKNLHGQNFFRKYHC